MPFTAKEVKELRDMTGVGMMACKKALTETDGDIEKAVSFLREKGLADAQKKAGRVTAEGMAYADVYDNIGVVVEVNAETDFVAQNDKFVDFVKGVSKAVADNDAADLDALKAVKFPGSDKTIQDMQQEMVQVIGENITIRRFARYTTGISVPYVHAGGKIGVLVNMDVDGVSDMNAITTLGKDIAMQIAAMNPLYLDTSSVDATELEKETEIQLNKAIEENRAKNLPEDKAQKIAENMVKGRINKFYEDICLLNQPYVKENKTTVAQHVKNVAKELGGTITVKGFTRFERGDGIEKKQENFADEISKLVK